MVKILLLLVALLAVYLIPPLMKLPLPINLVSQTLIIPLLLSLLILQLLKQPGLLIAWKSSWKNLSSTLLKTQPQTMRLRPFLLILLIAWGLCYLLLIAVKGDPDNWGVFIPFFFWPSLFFLIPLIIIAKDLLQQLKPHLAIITIFILASVVFTAALMVTVMGLFLVLFWPGILILLSYLLVQDFKTLRRTK